MCEDKQLELQKTMCNGVKSLQIYYENNTRNIGIYYLELAVCLEKLCYTQRFSLLITMLTRGDVAGSRCASAGRGRARRDIYRQFMCGSRRS